MSTQCAIVVQFAPDEKVRVFKANFDFGEVVADNSEYMFTSSIQLPTAHIVGHKEVQERGNISGHFYNDFASWLAGTTLYGDVVIWPNSKTQKSLDSIWNKVQKCQWVNQNPHLIEINDTNTQDTVDIANHDSIDLSNINITSNKKFPKRKSKSNMKLLKTSTNVNDSIESSSSSSLQVEESHITSGANSTKSKPKSKSTTKSKVKMIGTSDSDFANSGNTSGESINVLEREISANAHNRNQYMQEKIQANLNNVDMDSSDLKNESSVANCKCRKTKCLKLYCDCFKIGLFCEGCDCTECYNKPGVEFESIRKDAMEATLGKNPVAFKPRVMEDSEAKGVGHVAGCRCKRSNCLKKYCECFNGNAVCIPKCRCIDCKNKSEEFHENNRANNEYGTNLSFQSVGSSGCNMSYMSADFKPAVLRQPSSALTTSGKKRRSATKSNIDSIIQSISDSKKKSDETTMSSPMTKLIELAGLCEDR